MPDDPKLQADKFRELARALECDEDEAKFEKQVRRVAVTRHEEDAPVEDPSKPRRRPEHSD